MADQHQQHRGDDLRRSEGKDPGDLSNASGPAREAINGWISVGDRIGPYKVTGFIARGAFSCVVSGEDKKGKCVAIKVGDINGGGRYVTRFLEPTSMRSPRWISADETPAEAVIIKGDKADILYLDPDEIAQLMLDQHRLLRGLQHRSFVQVDHELYTFRSRPETETDFKFTAMAMEFVEGPTLRELLRDEKNVTVNWFHRIAETLTGLSERGYLSYHGDLKPENIVIKPNGGVVLLDPSPYVWGRGYFVATPFYNPLLFRDSRADVMAIGIMLYEILTGKLPFEEVPLDWPGKKLDIDPSPDSPDALPLSYALSYTPILDLNPSAHPMLVDIVGQCFNRAVGGHYTLGELKTDLKNYLSRKEK